MENYPLTARSPVHLLIAARYQLLRVDIIEISFDCPIPSPLLSSPPCCYQLFRQTLCALPRSPAFPLLLYCATWSR